MWLFKSWGKAEEKPDDKVSVNAPIVLNGRSKSGVKPLTDFIAALESNSNVAIAAAEGLRLKPYFNALSGFISRALEHDAPRSATETAALKEAATPEGLCTLFNLVAERTQNTILSDVAIVPSSVLTEGPASHFFLDQPQFSVPYENGGLMFNFGFLQVFQGGNDTPRSSTAFPVFVLDKGMMNEIAGHKPEKLLQSLQSALTFINHDMLHHFTMPVLGAHVAKKFTFEGSGFTDTGANPMNAWLQSLPLLGESRLYEDWAQVSHEKALLAPENAAQVEELKSTVTQYFAELKRIGAEIAKDDPWRGHVVADYYGMVMVHALTRVFPLDHPVMTHCLDALHDADPKPSTPLGCVNDMLDASTKMKDADFAILLKTLRHSFALNPETGAYLENYRKHGIDLLPEDDNKLNWKQMKLLQLVRISARDIRPHMEEPVADGVKQLRGNADAKMLDMVAAAANTFKSKPQPL